MNQKEFKEYYQKNKTVVVGVPIIILVLLLDLFILKPSRRAREQERLGGAQTTVQQPIATTAAPTGAVQPESAGPIAPPEPIQTPVYPQLSEQIDARFEAREVYPYGSGRNIFNRIEHAKIEVIPELAVEEEEIFVRPEISYHGFFTLGKDRVAVLRFADELLLTRAGALLKHGPFFLSSVMPDKVVIADRNNEIKDFEISLSEKP